RCAFNIRQDILGCPLSALLCYRTELWQSVSIISFDIREVTDCIDSREAPNTEIELNLDSPAVSLRQPQVTGDRCCLEARSPDHATALNGAAIGQYDVTRMHFFHGIVEFENHTAAL